MNNGVPVSGVDGNNRKLVAVRKLLLYTGAVVLIDLAVVGQAAAQNATPPAAPGSNVGDGMGDIIITARKRSESLQKVPLAITAFSGDKLEEKNVQSLRDLSTITPGLVISDLGAEAQTSPVIRGVAQTNILRNGENNVSSFLDGVYIYNLNSINLSVLDLERVEVVKGPVSALYGRNSFAGAINYITRKPSLTQFGARLEGEIGSYGKRRAVAAVSVPIINDKLAVRIAGVLDDYNGSYKDQVNHNKLGDYRKRGGQITFMAKPVERLKIFGTFYYAKDKLGQAPASYLVNNCVGTGPSFKKYCGRIPNGSDLPAPEAPTSTVVKFAGNDRKVIHGNVHVNFDLGGATIESITGYNKADTEYFSEFNKRRNGFTYATTAGGTYTTNTFFGRQTNTKDYSEELRVASGVNQPFRWQLGAFYYHLDIDTSTIVAVDTSRLPAGQNLIGFANVFATRTGQPAAGRGLGTTDQYSAFAVADYDVTDRLTASLEARYTHERKFFNQVTSTTGAPDIDGSGRTATFNYPDTRATLNYKMTPDNLLYASAAHGTKAGGFNDSATVPQDYTYKQETNWTYEVGSKNEFLNRTLQVNAALFYIDWTNPQLPRPSSDPNNTAVQVGNVGKIHVKGFDLETQFRASRVVDLRAAVNYADAKFAKGAFDISSGANCAAIPSCASSRLIVVNGNKATDLNGLQLPRESKWNVTAGIDLHDRISHDWKWFAGVDYSFLSKQYFENSNFAYWGARNSLNGRIGVSSSVVRVTFNVDNILNDSTPINAESNLRLNDFVFETLPILPEKRRFSLTVAYKI